MITVGHGAPSKGADNENLVHAILRIIAEHEEQAREAERRGRRIKIEMERRYKELYPEFERKLYKIISSL